MGRVEGRMGRGEEDEERVGDGEKGRRRAEKEE
jgi:hypothetical protein